MSSANFHTQTHHVDGAYIRQYPHALARDQEQSLKLAVKQYTPHDNPNPAPGDVTILAAHANGVGKELYEPLWDDLYSLSNQNGGFRIRNIWMADVAWQGESGVLNEEMLGNDPSWYDHARDLLHFINTFRKQLPRPIVGVGHSMGGNQLINLSLMHPRLLTGVILVDPVVHRTPSREGNFTPAVMSTFRRDVWPSREEAEAAFRRNKFYQSWDPRCLDLWFQYGLRELPTAIYSREDGGLNSREPNSKSPARAVAGRKDTITPKPVTLTTTKYQEVFTFLRGNYPLIGSSLDAYEPDRSTHPDLTGKSYEKPFYRPENTTTFNNLPHLQPPCLYVFAGEKSALSDSTMVQDRLETTGTGIGGNGGVKGGGVESVDIKGAGHFVPFEKPLEVAESMERWLCEKLRRWEYQEDLERATWGNVDPKQKTTFTKERIYWTNWAKEEQQRVESKQGGGSAKL